MALVKARHFVLRNGVITVEFWIAGGGGPKLVYRTPDGPRTFTGARLKLAATRLGVEITVPIDDLADWKRWLTLILPTVLLDAGVPETFSTNAIYTEIGGVPGQGTGPRRGAQPHYQVLPLTGTADLGLSALPVSRRPAAARRATASRKGARRSA